MVATGLAARRLPPGQADHDLRLRGNDVFVDAHRKAVDAIRTGAPACRWA